MADEKIVVDATGALAALGEVLDRATDLSPVLAGPINKSVDTLFTRQFDSEGQYGGTRWAPRAPVTQLLLRRPGHGRGGIGRDTNRMWASLTKGGSGPEAIRVVTPTSLERGTTVPYARWFAAGYVSKTFVAVGADGQPVPLYRRRPKRIPARPLVPNPIPDVIVRVWQRLIETFIAGGKSAA